MVLLKLLKNMIYVIRGQRVMLDSDLARLYGVETVFTENGVAMLSGHCEKNQDNK